METSQFEWIDTHCHLYSDEFGVDRDLMVERALAAGVSKLMMPNIDLDSIPGMWELANKYPGNCMSMMGLHPCSVKADFQAILDRMEDELASGSYVGVGETGIDLYWDKTYVAEQILAFERQIGWAKTHDLPIIIHSRESLEHTIEIVSRHQDGRLKGIFHCFGGSIEQVKQIEQLGFKVGIGGVVTFKKAGLDVLLPHIPLEMIVLETDAPYLAPVPNRGKRNEPAYILLVAQRVAEVLNIELSALARITSDNAEAVYGKKD